MNSSRICGKVVRAYAPQNGHWKSENSIMINGAFPSTRVRNVSGNVKGVKLFAIC